MWCKTPAQLSDKARAQRVVQEMAPWLSLSLPTALALKENLVMLFGPSAFEPEAAVAGSQQQE